MLNNMILETYTKLPAFLQLAAFKAALFIRVYNLAWDMADHANHDRLDVDAMLSQVDTRHHYQNG
jgi:hypothetical protein